MDTLTSLRITTFAIIGSLAVEKNISVEEVADYGIDFAFTHFPDGVLKFGIAPQFFSALFFLMLFTLGLGSTTALAGGIVTIACDQFPHWKSWSVTLLVCSVGFLIGLLYLTPGGRFMINLVDYFGTGFVIYIAVILEIIGVCWVYGLNNFCQDVEFMLGITIGLYWKLCWSVIIPAGLGWVLCDLFAKMDQQSHELHMFPAWASAGGWMLAAISLLLIPLFAIIEVYSTSAASITEKIKQSLRPTVQWGPRQSDIRKSWMEYREKRHVKNGEPVTE